MKRREFLEIGGSVALLGKSGGIQQLENASDVQQYGLLIGSGRPTVARMGQEWDTFRFVHIDPQSGKTHMLSHTDQRWQEITSALEMVSRGDLPATTDVPPGILYLIEETRSPVWNDGNAWEMPTFTDDVILSDQTVTNTTTETTIFNEDVDAGSLITGRQITTHLMGRFSTVNNSVTFTLRFYVEGSQVASVGNVGANVTGAPWSVQMHMTVREGGDGGTISCHTMSRINDSIEDQNQGETMLTLGTASSIEATIQWSAADPGNEVLLSQGYAEQRNYDAKG